MAVVPAAATVLLSRLEDLFEAARDPARASGMTAYMRGAFPYYGIPATTQRTIARAALDGMDPPDEPQLKNVAEACWKRAEREWQYFGCGYLRRNIRVATVSFLSTAERLIRTKSWWDTVDSLAAHTVGPLVRSHRPLAKSMDTWIVSEDIWVARTALLHQLSYKKDTDADRLFDYCLHRAADKEFFIRKAIGWALREYSKTDAGAVRAFVRKNASELSGLSRREALKWLERGRRSSRARA